jgi:hypothetical protein
MQFLVPQFIETEDKVVGPLTLRQFGYIAVAGTVCFILYFILNFAAWIVFTVLFGGTGLAFAFLKWNGRPLSVVVRAGWSYFWQPQQYVWQENRPQAKAPAVKEEKERGISLEKVVQSVALKTAWRVTSTGSKEPEAKTLPPQKAGNERYQIFRGLTGEQRAAKRIDYR